MDGYRRFEEDPKRHWEAMLSPVRESRFGDSIREAKPNAGHYSLAELESM
jgi:NAD-dependent SIR2 family protein deacetylase